MKITKHILMNSNSFSREHARFIILTYILTLIIRRYFFIRNILCTRKVLFVLNLYTNRVFIITTLFHLTAKTWNVKLWFCTIYAWRVFIIVEIARTENCNIVKHFLKTEQLIAVFSAEALLRRLVVYIRSLHFLPLCLWLESSAKSM